MKGRTVYRVQPRRRGRGASWQVRKNERPHLETAFKYQAVQQGRALARAEHARGGLSQLVIHGRNGEIQTEHTYGQDPRRFKG